MAAKSAGDELLDLIASGTSATKYSGLKPQGKPVFYSVKSLSRKHTNA